MSFLKLTDQNVNGKTVLIRADLNVPFQDGKISDDTRVRASLASIRYCLDNGAGVIVMSHLGRPTEGEFKPEDDVTPVAKHLGELLGKEVSVLNDWQGTQPEIKTGEVVMLQNVQNKYLHHCNHYFQQILVQNILLIIFDYLSVELSLIILLIIILLNLSSLVLCTASLFISDYFVYW